MGLYFFGLYFPVEGSPVLKHVGLLILAMNYILFYYMHLLVDVLIVSICTV